MSASASLSRDAGAGTCHQQQGEQQDPGLTVRIECYQSTSWLSGHGSVLKEVIVSFKRRPSEEPGRSFRAHGSLEATLPQQQDGLEGREPQSQGQGSPLKCSGGLHEAPGQMSDNARMGRPESGRERATSVPWTIGYTAPQQPQVTRRRFTEGTINNTVILEQLGAQALTSEAVASTREQEWEGTIGPELCDKDEWEDALDAELSEEEEWADAIDTELYEGTDDIRLFPAHHCVSAMGLEDNKGSYNGPREGPSCPSDERTIASATLEGSQYRKCPSDEDNEGEDSTAIVIPAAQEESSLVGEQAAAHPDPGQAHSYTIPFSTFLDALFEGNQMWHRTVMSVPKAAQGKGEQKRQHPTGCKQALPEAAQSARADGLGKDQPGKHGPGQQLEEREPDLELSMKEATEAGTPAGPAFRSPSPTVINALARERRTSFFKTSPRALPRAFTVTPRTGEQKEQKATARALDVDTAQFTFREFMSKAVIVIQRPNMQTEEQEHLEHSTDATWAETEKAAGAVRLAHELHSPTADVSAIPDKGQYIPDEVLREAAIVIQGSEEHMDKLRDLEEGTREGIRVTAPAVGTENPGHTVHSPPADAPVFLGAKDNIRTEVIKKAVLMVQKPFEYSEEQQDQEPNTEESTAEERSAGCAQSQAHETQSPPADAVVWLDANNYMQSKAIKKAVIMVQRPFKELDEPWLQEQSIDKEMRAKARAAGAGSLACVPHRPTAEGPVLLDTAQHVTGPVERTESSGHTRQSPTADAPVFLNAKDYCQRVVVKKAVLMVQKPFEYSEEQQDQEPSTEESTAAERPAGCAQSQAHETCSPPGAAVVWLDAKDFIRTEVVKKAFLMVQEPFEYPEEE